MLPDSNDNDNDVNDQQGQPMVQKTFCVNGVATRTGPLNEAVARVANLTSFEQANELIEIGAVWARMDALSEEDVLNQYYGGDFEANARALYADLNYS